MKKRSLRKKESNERVNGRTARWREKGKKKKKVRKT